MSTQHAEIFAALAAPFDKVKSRSGGGGQQLYYLTSRQVENRLDEVLGPENWDFELFPWGENALIGTLVLRLPDGSTMRKSNVGGKAEMKASDDETKSAASDCLKRCAELYGIGRSLYNDGVPAFAAHLHTNAPQPQVVSSGGGGGYSGGGNNGGYSRQSAPQQQAPPTQSGGYNRNGSGNGNGSGGYTGPNNPPRTGKALFAWAMKEKDNGNPGALKAINDFGKANDLGDRMVQWPDDAVADAYAAVTGGGQRQQQPAGHPSQQPRYNGPPPVDQGDDGPDF
jgi:hypothetical protein